MNHNYLSLIIMDSGLYKIDHLTLNVLRHLITNCNNTDIINCDYIKSFPLELWFNDFWDEVGHKIDYITTNLNNYVVFDNGENILFHIKVSNYATLNDYKEYINKINGYLCIYAINKVVNLEKMEIFYAVSDCVITNKNIVRDISIRKILEI